MENLIAGATELGIELNAAQVRQFELYYRELIGWNKKINLTSITAYSSVQIKHFLDSLTITLLLPEREARESGYSIIDIGTGAGFPGIPLKIVFPWPRLVLVEPTAKKTAFLNHLICTLKLENVEVLNSRAEEAGRLSPYREQFSLVLSRAVASLSTLVELTLPFCRIGGRLIAQKKGDIGHEVHSAGRAIATLGGRLDRVKEVRLKALGEVRYLVIIDKISSTPDRYPRRPGIPGKRPIQEVSEHVA
jgi:16S rRNA (guanine527-N7)-methyltransferase